MAEHGFLYQALIYLAAGVVAVPLFRRLGLGSVLGFLAAGMVIGPWGFALVAHPETVLQFAEFGVVLLLFLVGLELNPQRLWRLRRTIFLLGPAQIASTVAATAALGWAFDFELGIALIAGMGFAQSSTAIALGAMQERGLLQTAGAQSAISVSLFQDLAVIPLLLAVALIVPAAEPTGLDWAAVLRAALLIGLLIGAGHYALRPVLRLVATSGQREVFVALALLLVLGAAALMQAVGLSMALGAFLAGVVLADSEYRHELEIDIEPFKGLLLGLFFIAVGMSVNLALFVREPLLVLGLALAVVALKIALLYPIGRWLGLCGRADALVFAFGLSNIGEFAFVLFSAGSAVLPRPVFDVLNAAVAVSMITTPLLITFYARAIAPRLAQGAAREADVFDEANPVLVAGFGRFGQVVARVLNGLGLRATLIDHDPNQIELVRRFGQKAYYGDATRFDVLEKAGIARARLLVVAIDDSAAALRLVREARKRYPALKLVTRAHGRSDAFEYFAMGVPAVREVFGSALDAAEAVLRALDFGPMAARRVVTRFRRHDEEMLAAQAPHRGEAKKLIALQQQGRDDLERVLKSELGASGG
ncbi:MAG: monovalent cation:proton antiporter-2 (CPA2) family protein [Burkholderiales bacterium]